MRVGLGGCAARIAPAVLDSSCSLAVDALSSIGLREAVKDVLVASRRCGAVMVLLTLAAVAAGTAGAGMTWSRCLLDISCVAEV